MVKLADDVKDQLEKIAGWKRSYANCVKLIKESVMRCAGINPEVIDGGLRPAVGTMCMRPAAGATYCGDCCNSNASLGEKNCSDAKTTAEKTWCKNNTKTCLNMCNAMQTMEADAKAIANAENRRQLIEEGRMRQKMKESMKNTYAPYTQPMVDPYLRARQPGM